jgi:hypothetical protein
MLRSLIALGLILTTVPAYPQSPYAQVLRCVDAEGKVEYRASPCPADAREQVVVAKTSTSETNAGDTSVGGETSAVPPVRRRTNISEERKQALDASERYAAIARAARPQVALQVLPLPPAK